MLLARLVFLTLGMAIMASGVGVTVGVFAAPGIFGRSWNRHAPNGCGHAEGQARHVCNLAVYKSAIDTAAAEGVELLVFPESYSLGDWAPTSRYYEPLDVDVNGTMPCFTVNGTERPTQKAIACAAAEHGVAVAVNLMTRLPNGTRHITELVFDTSGTITSVYHKRLFPLERLWVEPGLDAPTTFDLFGQRWGVVVCWEGLKPFISKDFSQIEALVSQGASAIIWPVAASAELMVTAQTHFAKRFGVKVLGTGGYGRFGPASYPAFTDEKGKTVQSQDVAIGGLDDLGYSAEAFVRKAEFYFDTPVFV